MEKSYFLNIFDRFFFFFFMPFFTFSGFIFVKASVYLDDFDFKKNRVRNITKPVIKKYNQTMVI